MINITNLLIKLFIKNHKEIDNPKVRIAYGLLSSIVGIILNLLLFGIKLFIGLVSNSISIIADSFNNLSDASSSIISFIGIKLAGKPVDKEHCFGHGRIEYISAFIVSLLMLQVGFSLLKDSVIKIISPEPIHFNLILAVILAISILAKVWLHFFNKGIGNKINSSVIKAIAIDALNDVYITSATVISLLVWRITGLNVDGYIGLIVSIFIIISGLRIAKDTINLLVGEPVDKETYISITKQIESYKGIIGIHDLIIHKYGQATTMATVHVEVPNTANIEEIHNIVDKIERDILKELGVFLVIHVDPVAINDEKMLQIRDSVLKTIKDIELNASIHDFRMINEDTSISLMFDLVLPYSYTQEDDKNILCEITNRLNNIYNGYKYVITIDKE